MLHRKEEMAKLQCYIAKEKHEEARLTTNGAHLAQEIVAQV